MAITTNSDTNFRTESDNLKWLLALLNNYGMYTDDISAISNIGFNVHVLNDLNENTAYVADQAKKESFVITANYMDSIYKHAREVGVEPTFARCASMTFIVSISEENFLANAVQTSSNVRKYIISKSSFISVGNFIYSLDYDIEIKMEYGVGDDKYLTARYVTGTIKNPISELRNNNIKVVREVSSDGTWVYSLYLILKQYQREIIEQEFGDRDYAIFPVTAKAEYSEIAGIQVFHIPSNIESRNIPVELDKKMYFEKSRTSVDTVFLRYDSAKSFTVIHKSQEGGFRPNESDKIRIILYTTEGEDGNFQFSSLSGDNIIFHSNVDNVLRPMITLLNGESSGGVTYDNGKELLRKNIITRRGARNSIITENDLLLILNDLNVDNDYYVIKNRNDILKIFNVFTALNFVNNNITYTIPTNTLNVDWNYRSETYALDNGDNVWQLKTKYATCEKAHEGILCTEDHIKSLDTLKLRYSVPYIVTFNRSKNIVRFYSDYCDNEYVTDSALNNTRMPYSYICNWVRFEKDKEGDALEVEFQVRTNIAGTIPNEKFFRITNDTTMDIESTGFMQVYLILTDKDDNEVYKTECELKAYTVDDDNKDDDFFTFGATMIDKGEDNIRIKNDKVRVNDPANRSNYLWLPIDKLKGRIEIWTPTERSEGSKVLDIKRGKINTFSFDCDLFRNESTNFKIQHQVLDNDSIRMYYFPLVAYDFLKDHYHLFRKSIEAKDFLNDYLARFQGEFTYSLKFANTYGMSDLYDVGIKSDTKIDNVVLTMKFMLELKDGSNLSEEELNLAIARYINNIDFYGGDTFHVSRLYDFLYTLYPKDISLIQFESINNLKSDKQFLKVDSKNINNRTVIEKLSLPIKYDKYSKKWSYDIKWTYIKS